MDHLEVCKKNQNSFRQLIEKINEAEKKVHKHPTQEEIKKNNEFIASGVFRSIGCSG